MPYNLKQIVEFATSQGYKSNVVKPLSGVLIILFLTIGGLIYHNADMVIVYTILAMAVLAFIGFGVSYFYCLFNNPDLLRSEKYNLEKTAIEKVAFSGDSLTTGKVVTPTMDYIVVESINQISPNEEIKKIEE